MSRFHVTKDMWLAAMRADGLALRTVAGDLHPDLAVPSRPRWTMRDLLHNLGSTYRWVNAHVARGVTTPPPEPVSRYLDEPFAADVVAWWDVQFTVITATLDAVDADTPAWNWAPQAKRASFWHRRLAMETAVSRWDAQMAAGTAEPIEAKLATDGVAEVLDTFLPAGRRASIARPTGLIALHATDIEHTWHVRLRGDGVSLLDTGTILDVEEPRARATAAGTASDLMLALHGRVGIDVLDVTGDEQLIEAIRVD